MSLGPVPIELAADRRRLRGDVARSRLPGRTGGRARAAPSAIRAPNVTRSRSSRRAASDAALRLPRKTVLTFDQRCFLATQRWKVTALPTNDCAADHLDGEAVQRVPPQLDDRAGGDRRRGALVTALLPAAEPRLVARVQRRLRLERERAAGCRRDGVDDLRGVLAARLREDVDLLIRLRRRERAGDRRRRAVVQDPRRLPPRSPLPERPRPYRRPSCSCSADRPS